MPSRFWTFERTIADGQWARSEPVNNTYSQIDAALASVAAELNGVFRFPSGAPGDNDFLINLTPAQRANQILGFDQNGRPQVQGGTFTWRGAWQTLRFYRVNDTIQAPESAFLSVYVCMEQHTSGDFAADLAAGRWQLAIDNQAMFQSVRRFQIITNAYTARSGDDLFVNVAGGGVAITLPPAPLLSDQPITICHVGGNIASNPIVVLRNGKRIMSLQEDMTINTPNASVELSFCNEQFGWRLVKGT